MLKLQEIAKMINLSQNTTHDFLAEVKDDIVVITDKNELALPVALSLNELTGVILVQSAIIPVAVIPESERAILNFAILESNINTPLSSVGILNGVYVMFGELSANSSDADLLLEIETLVENTNEFTASIRSEYLQKSA